jgi:hypothetical protein
MNYKILLPGLLSSLLYVTGQCQQWIRIYGDSVNTVTNTIYEHYDKGYILSGERYNPGYTVYGWILKTDINGNERWAKMYGNNSAITRLFGTKPTLDGGIIEAGLLKTSPPGCSDPIIIKINACGEKEWCKVYDATYCYSTCYDICLINDGGYMALMDHWKYGEEETIWLFRLDSAGEVIWAQAYATDTAFWSEWSHSLLTTTDSCFVITGEAYYPDPTYPNKKIIKIILIKVNLDGKSIFEVPWGTNNGIYSDGRLSTIDSKNNIYTAGRRARTTSPYGDSPCLFKTSKIGNPVFYKDLKTTSELGIATTINWFLDSSLVQCMYWGSEVGNDTTGLITTDSLGNQILIKPLLINSACSFYGSDITYNDRLILGGGVYENGLINTYAFKLNSDLEYDSIYTTPFTYDSLCPYPIVSDTIPLDDCEVVVVGIDEARQNPETTKLKVYPNPSDERITIELPKYLVRKSSGQGMTANTIYHQWTEVRLEVFDLHGQLMFCEAVPQQKKSITLNVSSWPPGMYLARLVFMNEVVGREKFVIN